MTLEAVAFLPGSPMALPAVSHAQYAAHRDEVLALQDASSASVAAVLDLDEPAEVVVTLASGASTQVHGARRADLAGLGIPSVLDELPGHPVADELADALGAGSATTSAAPGQVAVPSDVLALLARSRADVPVVCVEVADDLGAPDALAFGRRLGDVLGGLPTRLVLLVAADLSAARDATAPRYFAPGALAFEDEAVAAVRAHDLDALAGMAGRAADSRAVGFTSLLAGTAVAAVAGVPTDGLSHVVARGVGHLVGAAAAERLVVGG